MGWHRGVGVHQFAGILGAGDELAANMTPGGAGGFVRPAGYGAFVGFVEVE